MSVLVDPLFEDGYDLTEVTISLTKDASHGQVKVTITGVGERRPRRSESVIVDLRDVAGLENVPEVLRIIGQMWLWDDVDLVRTGSRLVKKGRRPVTG